MIRTAIFCGSFDPIHTGHAMLANHVAQSGLVDELWLMPSRVNPLKTAYPPVADHHRLAMCRLVAARSTGVKASDYEQGLPAPSYTYDTLSGLRKDFPDRSFVLLTGADNWLCFDKWRNHESIIKEFGLLIYPRPGYEVIEETLPESVRLLSEAPQMLVSSTFIRKGLREERNMSFLLPSDVLDYIKKEQLYE